MARLLELRDEDAGLAGGGLVGVRAVDQVGLNLQPVVAADRAGSGLHRVGGADHLPGGLHRLVALQHQGDQRAAGDELDQLAEERLLRVLGVVLLGLRALDGHVLEGGDLQALALEAGDDLARQVALERVRLDQDQGPCHVGSFLSGDQMIAVASIY
jgi:hypothetical protein